MAREDPQVRGVAADLARLQREVDQLQHHAVKYFNEHGYRIVKLRRQDVLTLGGQWIRLPEDMIDDELNSDFYEDDEPIEDIRTAWRRGEPGRTSGPRRLSPEAQERADRAAVRQDED